MDKQRTELKRERLLRLEAESKLKKLLGKYFDKSSEKIDPAQLELLLEGLEEDAALQSPPKPEVSRPKKTYRKKRASFPEDMVDRCNSCADP